jgi:hypothetical protein
LVLLPQCSCEVGHGGISLIFDFYKKYSWWRRWQIDAGQESFFSTGEYRLKSGTTPTQFANRGFISTDEFCPQGFRPLLLQNFRKQSHLPIQFEAMILLKSYPPESETVSVSRNRDRPKK